MDAEPAVQLTVQLLLRVTAEDAEQVAQQTAARYAAQFAQAPCNRQSESAQGAQRHAQVIVKVDAMDHVKIHVLVIVTLRA